MIVRTSKNKNATIEVKYSLCPGGLLHGKTKRISNMLVFRLDPILLLLNFQTLEPPPYIVHIPTNLNQILT